MKTKEILRYAQRLRLRYLHANKVLSRERGAKALARKRFVQASKAQEIIQTVAQSVQQQAHEKITALVTRCLATVFDDPYTFQIKFERKRGKTDARMCFTRRGMELSPTEGVGGGVLDVAAFALRLACLMLQRPKRRRLVIFDEPFKNVNGEEMQRRVSELVLRLASELKLQFIIVTDDDWLRIGKVIQL